MWKWKWMNVDVDADGKVQNSASKGCQTTVAGQHADPPFPRRFGQRAVGGGR
jgi:hypothetical protein